ncbi:MAG: thioredoxin domain-containing protein [Thermodesulfobacteriota bacterium]
MDPKYTNRLINEGSFYLRQHAHNPVDWYPWGKEAISRAKRENKPIFLSIGYSSCHWCHVMEKECFANEEIARIMNERFINIKVDREERPDLDEIYMRAVQLISGSGGWPLNVFLTPQLVPFFGGTYFPPVERRGMISFPKVLIAISEYYRTHQQDVEKEAFRIRETLQKMEDLTPGVEEIDPQIVTKAQEIFVSQFDPLNGGFSPAPKFPNPPILLFLLRQYKNAQALAMVKLTLDKMAHGGIYDHLGGGFHRYAIDNQWIVPHFEKMLYDNALLARLYLEAYQATQKRLYLQVAERIFDYILREMRDPQGGFYSSQDADSEGEEGKFFLWTKEEVLSLLGENQGNIFCAYYGITAEGNFGEGRNVIYVANSKEKISGVYGISLSELESLLTAGRKILFAEREKRTKPATDKKIITAWNGLMISAFVLGFEITENNNYLKVAQEAASFIIESMKRNGLLFRALAKDQPQIMGFADDYAFFIQALLDLYEATFDKKYLKIAIDLNQEMIDRFGDEQNGGYFYTAKEKDSLIIRPKNIYDQVIPSANSIAVSNLIRLSFLMGDELWRERARKIIRLYYPSISENPLAFSYMLSNFEFFFNPIEIKLIGFKDYSKTQRMLSKIYKRYLPHKILDYQDPPELPRDGKEPYPSIIICRQFTCLPALHEEEELEKVLSNL